MIESVCGIWFFVYCTACLKSQEHVNILLMDLDINTIYLHQIFYKTFKVFMKDENVSSLFEKGSREGQLSLF